MTLVLLYYLAAITVITFLAFGIDKWKARHQHWRIPESVLLGMAAIGGSIGAMLGMKVWRHKTQHKKFTIGVPAILIVQLGIVGMLLIIMNSTLQMPH